MWITRFKVQGSGSLPLDMLRYDTCYPATQADVSQSQLDDSAPLREIELERLSESKSAAERLTFGRWQSFGWNVVEGSVRIKKA